MEKMESGSREEPDIGSDIGETTPISAPKAWPESYTLQDREAVAFIINWLKNNQRGQAWLARRARMNTGTLNSVLNGKYGSSPTEWITKAKAACALDEERRTKKKVPFVATSISRIIHSVCHRARTYRVVGCITGSVGVGKTRALMEYAASTPNTILIEGHPSMGISAVLDDLIDATGASVKRRKGTDGTLDNRMRALIEKLRESDTLLILDEAETVQPRVLEQLRRLSDKASVGLVLSGTEYLDAILKREHGHFGQMRSRTNFWPAHMRGISKAEMQAVLQSAFEDQTLDAATVDMFWLFCCGSMRVLVQGLIPAVRDFGLGQGHPLNSATVKSVAKDVLGLQARQMKEAA